MPVEKPPRRINAQYLQVNRRFGLLGGRLRYPETPASLKTQKHFKLLICGTGFNLTLAACPRSTDTFTVVIISLTMMTVKILQLPAKTHK